MSNFPDPTPQKSWWGRNWIWVVPLGCLAPILVCCGGGLSIGLFVFGTLKNSDVYKEAFARATADAEVKKQIGEPVTADFWVVGAIQINAGNGGHAELLIPISGPKGSAQIRAVAENANDRWNFTTLEVQAYGGGKLIHLLPDAGKSEARQKSKALP